MKTLQANVKTGKTGKNKKAAAKKAAKKPPAKRAAPAPTPAGKPAKGKKADPQNDTRFSLAKFGGARVDSKGLPINRQATQKKRDLATVKEPANIKQYYDQLKEAGEEGEVQGAEGDAESESESSDYEGDSVSLGSDVFDNEEQEELTEDASRRLALKNCDWDHLNASHLYALLQSFTPMGGALVRVRIYTSTYGKEQIAYEKKHGPNIWVREGDEGYDEVSNNEEEEEEGLKFEPEGGPAEDEDSADFVNDVEEDNPAIKTEVGDDGERFSENKYRRYEIQRLKYYYAIVEFDTVETASHVYRECEGTEIERSGNSFDLSFVPDEMDFDDEEPTDSCTQLAPSYKGNTFVTNALQNSRFAISWDQTDPKRKQTMSKLFEADNEEDDDLAAYLAPNSESESDDGLAPEEKQRAIRKKYAALFEGIGGLPEEMPDEDGESDDDDEEDEEVSDDNDGEGLQAVWSDDDDDDHHEAPSDSDNDDHALVRQQMEAMDDDEEGEEDDEDGHGVMGDMSSTIHMGAKEGSADLRKTMLRNEALEGETVWERRQRIKKEGRKMAKKERATKRKDEPEEVDVEEQERQAARLREVMQDESAPKERKPAAVVRKEKRKAQKLKKIEASAAERQEKRDARMQSALKQMDLPKKKQEKEKEAKPVVSEAASQLVNRFGKLADPRFNTDVNHPKFQDSNTMKEVMQEVRAVRKRKTRDEPEQPTRDADATDISSSVAFFKKRAKTA